MLDNVCLEIWILLGIVHRLPDVVSECLGVFLIFDYDPVHCFKSQLMKIFFSKNLAYESLRSFFLLLVHAIDFIQHRYNDCFESFSGLLFPANGFIADDNFQLHES